MSARPVAPGFFPLDDELELLPGSLTPELHERLAELGARLPFDQARQVFRRFTQVEVSEPTARRKTESAGAAWVALETAAVEALEQRTPAAPPGAAKLVVQVDGAMVPIVGGDWVEVKTLAIETVGPPEEEHGELVVKTQDLSYFSRYAEAERFERLALVEVHRRGVERARQVAAVNDGAEWIQGFLDGHCPAALRILDFSHAAGYVAQIGQATFGADTPEFAVWLHDQLHALKRAGAAELLRGLREMVNEQAPARAEALELPQALSYLEKRREQMQYPLYQALGWPIGSGAVESGQKLVVEARLQGPGMHWAPAQIDPMLALRNVIANDCWERTWPLIERYLRHQAQLGRDARGEQRQALPMPPDLPTRQGHVQGRAQTTAPASGRSGASAQTAQTGTGSSLAPLIQDDPVESMTGTLPCPAADGHVAKTFRSFPPMPAASTSRGFASYR